MKTVFVTTPVKDRHRRMLAAAAGGRCRLVYADDGIDALETAEAVIGVVSPQRLASAQKLEWFQLVFAGNDRYRQHHFPPQVQFTNCSGAYGAVIAEHMMACILALYRQLRHYQALQEAHRWEPDWHEDTLEGKTVLILGTGDIGSALAKRLRGFDCRILGVRRTEGSAPEFDETCTAAQLDALLPQADVVACALPGTPQTAGLLDGCRLRAMKPNALLLNCGRGSLIDTKALEAVLAEGHLGGVALDVTDPEPLPTESSLWDCSRVILTPHISGVSFGHVAETEDRIYALAADNLRRWLDGVPLRNQVDFAIGYRRREE